MNATVKVQIQNEDFSLSDEYEVLRLKAETGAIVTFTGLVREFESETQSIDSLTLQHYPRMTERLLREIISDACNRWHLQAVTVIHRVGELNPTEQIVFVGTASSHRKESFQAAEFIMDYLKSKATFWKKVRYNNTEQWIEQNQSDLDSIKRW